MSESPPLLLVDDDPGLLRLLSLRLEAEGYAVDTADSAEAALVRLETHPPQLVITDLKMGEMDGLALFDHIHARQPALPVIMLTAHGSIQGAVAATRRGLYGYLTKPFSSAALLEEIARALSLGAASKRAPASGKLITRSALMHALLERARRLARADTSALIQGPSGSGKELIAAQIHADSPRCDGPFVAINCAAIPDNLLESELFGHRKGAFTGADRHRTGLIQGADGGTLFLDEIGDMPLDFQAKLLRCLEERRVRPVGGSEAVAVDLRVIAATHVDLERAIEAGQFREDLYYRLAVVTLEVPPLAERREDIALLAQHFLEQVIADNPHCVARSISPEALDRLAAAPWPGNVRQLRNVVEQACVLSGAAVISAALIGGALRGRDQALAPLAEAAMAFERDYLTRLLRTTEGNVTRAARLARRNRTEFYKLLGRHKLDAAQFRGSPA